MKTPNVTLGNCLLAVFGIGPLISALIVALLTGLAAAPLVALFSIFISYGIAFTLWPQMLFVCMAIFGVTRIMARYDRFAGNRELWIGSVSIVTGTLSAATWWVMAKYYWSTRMGATSLPGTPDVAWEIVLPAGLWAGMWLGSRSCRDKVASESDQAATPLS